MPEHTPGPWSWSIDIRHKDIRLNAGSLVVMDFARYGMQGAQPRFRLPAYGDILIECADLATNKQIGGWPHPDARLIAAAPELLEACERALSTAFAPDGGPQYISIDTLLKLREQLTAAIAKARGD